MCSSERIPAYPVQTSIQKSKMAEERRNLTLLWRIENLSYFDPEFHGREIDSPEFRALSLDGKALLMSLYPKGKDEDDPHVQILVTWFKARTKHVIDCEWSLLDDGGTPLITETLRNQELQLYKVVDMPSGPTHEEVFETKKSSFLPHDVLTVRLRIWKTVEDLEYAEHISSYTRIQAAEQSFIWSIERFKSLQVGKKVTIVVDIENFPDFQLNSCLIGDSLEDARLNFQIIAGETDVLNLVINLSILKGDKELKCVDGVYLFGDSIREQIWDLCIKGFVSRKEVLENKSNWLCGDDLTLRCKFTAVKKDTTELIERSYCGPTNFKEDTLI